MLLLLLLTSPQSQSLSRRQTPPLACAPQQSQCRHTHGEWKWQHPSIVCPARRAALNRARLASRRANLRPTSASAQRAQRCCKTNTGITDTVAQSIDALSRHPLRHVMLVLYARSSRLGTTCAFWPSGGAHPAEVLQVGRAGGGRRDHINISSVEGLALRVDGIEILADELRVEEQRGRDRPCSHSGPGRSTSSGSRSTGSGSAAPGRELPSSATAGQAPAVVLGRRGRAVG